MRYKKHHIIGLYKTAVQCAHKLPQSLQIVCQLRLPILTHLTQNLFTVHGRAVDNYLVFLTDILIVQFVPIYKKGNKHTYIHTHAHTQQIYVTPASCALEWMLVENPACIAGAETC